MQMSLGLGIQQMLIASGDYVLLIYGFQFSQEGCSTGKLLTQVLIKLSFQRKFYPPAAGFNVKC